MPPLGMRRALCGSGCDRGGQFRRGAAGWRPTPATGAATGRERRRAPQQPKRARRARRRHRLQRVEVLLVDGGDHVERLEISRRHLARDPVAGPPHVSARQRADPHANPPPRRCPPRCRRRAQPRCQPPPAARGGRGRSGPVREVLSVRVAPVQQHRSRHQSDRRVTGEDESVLRLGERDGERLRALEVRVVPEQVVSGDVGQEAGDLRR